MEPPEGMYRFWKHGNHGAVEDRRMAVIFYDKNRAVRADLVNFLTGKQAFLLYAVGGRTETEYNRITVVQGEVLYYPLHGFQVFAVPDIKPGREEGIGCEVDMSISERGGKAFIAQRNSLAVTVFFGELIARMENCSHIFHKIFKHIALCIAGYY